MPLVRCMLGSLRVRCRPRCRHRKCEKPHRVDGLVYKYPLINVNCSVWTSTPHRVARTATRVHGRVGTVSRPASGSHRAAVQHGTDHARSLGHASSRSQASAVTREGQHAPHHRQVSVEYDTASTVHQLHHVSRGSDRRDTTHPSASPRGVPTLSIVYSSFVRSMATRTSRLRKVQQMPHPQAPTPSPRPVGNSLCHSAHACSC